MLSPPKTDDAAAFIVLDTVTSEVGTRCVQSDSKYTEGTDGKFTFRAKVRKSDSWCLKKDSWQNDSTINSHAKITSASIKNGALAQSLAVVFALVAIAAAVMF